MKIMKEIVRTPIAELEESIEIGLTKFILNEDEIGCQEWTGRKFRQILSMRHVQSLDIEYPAMREEN
jgi:hypothetical protein